MIEIDFGKLILLALVALIVLGPEKLPGAARTAGALLRRVRGGWDNVRAEVERELEIEEIRRAAREAAAQAEAAQTQLDRTLRQAREPLEQATAKANQPYRLTDSPVADDEPSSSTDDGLAGATALNAPQIDPATPATIQGDRPAADPASVAGDTLDQADAGSVEPLPSATRAQPREMPVTGQLFADAPVPAEPPAATRNSAHGGH